MEVKDYSVNRVDTNYGRLYQIERDGVILKVPSVTTILSNIKEDRLSDLKAAIGDDVWAYVSKRGAERGTYMHRMCELFYAGITKFQDIDRALLFAQKSMITDDEVKDLDPKFKELGRQLFYNIYHSRITTEFKKAI